MVWKEKRVTLIGGRWLAGTDSRPVTRAFQLWKANSDSRCGIPIPYLIWPLVYQPRTCSLAPRVVLYRPSIAASLMGWSTAITRAIQSPTSTWTGAAKEAIVSGTVIATRSYRVHRPRSRQNAYAPAITNPVTM